MEHFSFKKKSPGHWKYPRKCYLCLHVALRYNMKAWFPQHSEASWRNVLLQETQVGGHASSHLDTWAHREAYHFADFHKPLASSKGFSAPVLTSGLFFFSYSDHVQLWGAQYPPKCGSLCPTFDENGCLRPKAWMGPWRAVPGNHSVAMWAEVLSEAEKGRNGKEDRNTGDVACDSHRKDFLIGRRWLFDVEFLANFPRGLCDWSLSEKPVRYSKVTLGMVSLLGW